MKIQMQEALNNIKELLVDFSKYIEMENKNGEFGINKIAENILGGLLEIIFECKFKNMNLTNPTYAGIDLADENKRIAVQITSENSIHKILKTLSIIREKKLFQRFDDIYIYILNKKRKYKNIEERIHTVIGADFYFPIENIMDLDDIYLKLSNCQDLNKILKAREYLIKHFGDNVRYGKSLEQQIVNAEKEEFFLMISDNRFYAKTGEHSQGNAGNYGISEKLFPRGFRFPPNYENYGISEEGVVRPLKDLYKEHMDENLILLGEGGIGKTTFLVHLMESFYGKLEKAFSQIPVYIELNRCPAQIGMWYSSHYKKTNFITRYIAAMLDGGSSLDIEEGRLNQIEEELRKKSEDGNIKYILLLDGLNEVSKNQTINENGNTGQSIRETLRREISVLSTYGNIRIILTSRRLDKVYLPDGFEVLYLKGLDISDIRDYLQIVNYSEVEINEIETSQELLNCLKIPLFLCMFACGNQNKKVKPLTRGEILYHFFHKESPFYGERKNIKTSFSKNYNEEIIFSFIMDFILPYIGNMMEGIGEFHVKRSDITDGIEYFLWDDEVPFWNTDIEIFREYEREGCLKDVLEIIKRIPVKQIMDCMTGTLGVINYDGKGGYSFIHHHVRDYFSSIYEIQWLRCAVALRRREQKKQKEPSEQVLDALGSIREEIWTEIKQIFVGEILSEHRNVVAADIHGNWYRPEPVFREQELLKSVLDIFRNKKAYPGKCICNIVQIMKKVRKNLSGEDFSGLDLRECRFYETVCSIGENEKRIAASFQNSILSDNTFYFEGHMGKYEDFEISDEKIYTLGSDERLLIWDMESYQCRKSFEVGNTFFPDTHVADRQIVIGRENDFLVKHYEYIYTEDGNELNKAQIRCYNERTQEYFVMECPEGAMGIWDMGYSADGKFIISVWENNYICVYDHYGGKLLYSFQYNGEGETRHIAMPEDNLVLLHIIAGEETEEMDENEEYIKSMCSFVSVRLPKIEYKLILSYQTYYSFNNENQQPAFSFDKSGWKALIFEEGKVKLLDIKHNKSTTIQEIPDGRTPESVCFLNVISQYIAIYYGNCYSIWDLSDSSHAIFSGEILEEAKKVIYSMNYIYVIDRSEDLYEWDIMEEERVRIILPQVELNILGIAENKELNELCIQYYNNSILIVDEETGKLKTSIFYPEYDMEMQYCEYLIKQNLLFMVLSSDESEEILVYSLKDGQSKKIHIDFKSRLRFHGAFIIDDEIYIGFDKKAVEIELNQLEVHEIWNAGDKEELLSLSKTGEEVRLLIKTKDFQSIPCYSVYRKDEQKEYVFVGNREAIFLSEEQAEKMISYAPGEFVGYCQKNAVRLYKKQGLFLEWDQKLAEIYERAGKRPWESTTIFYSVSNLAQSLSFEMYSQKHLEICDINDDYIVITENNYKVLVYHIESSGAKLMHSFSIEGDEEKCILSACFGSSGKLYCRLEDETLVAVDSATGKICEEYNWIPGLIIVGCDFRGAVVGENTKEF